MAHARAGHAHRRWRLSAKKGHIETVRNDINVTPLVDVMLVLLIIFMLMTMLMGRGQEVKIPRARNISSEPDKLQPIVSIDEKANLWVEKTKVGVIDDEVLHQKDKDHPPKALVDMGIKIQEVWSKKPRGAGRIYIKCDENVTYGQVFPILDYINKTPGLTLQAMDLAVAEAKQ